MSTHTAEAPGGQRAALHTGEDEDEDEEEDGGCVRDCRLTAILDVSPLYHRVVAMALRAISQQAGTREGAWQDGALSGVGQRATLHITEGRDGLSTRVNLLCQW